MICASMFNGCGVGAIAMIRANLPITKFYYSEIDKYANIVMQANFPDAIPIGDVTKVDASSFNGWFALSRIQFCRKTIKL